MKNIYLIPTSEESILTLRKDTNNFKYRKEGFKTNSLYQNYNIYITNNERIEDGYWFMIFTNKKPVAPSKAGLFDSDCKKIIFTTDSKLIADGVQEISEDFLNWFCNGNSSCEYVEVIKENLIIKGESDYFNYDDGEKLNKNAGNYKIIIPKEQPKFVTVNIESANGKDLGKVSCIPFPELDVPIKLDNVLAETPFHLPDFSHLKQENLEKWSLEKAQEFALEKFKKEDISKKGIITWESILEVLKVGVLTGHKFGTKYQQNKTYTEQEVGELLYNVIGEYAKSVNIIVDGAKLNDLFNEFKKK